MSSTRQLYQDYKNHLRKIADIKYAAALLQWDQEIYLPEKGASARNRQIATLTETAHKEFTGEHTIRQIDSLLEKQDLTPDEKRNLELSREDYQKSNKLPPEFVRKNSETVNRSFHKWIAARKENDFTVFRDALQDVVDIKREEADLLGYKSHPYNALINDYDKGLDVAFTDELFENLRSPLKNILDEIAKGPQVDNSFLFKHYNKDKQWEFGLSLLRHMQFDFSAGRQDISEHPFTINFAATDVRVTTRIDENDLANMTWSCIHEGGHALYEQGLRDEEYGLPLGEPCSLSIHESQSRLWENCVGRGLAYWHHHYPGLQEVFPEQLKQTDLQTFYRGINRVSPSLIRTEADELTYHFHIMIRYEIEKWLLEGTIRAADIPSAWNEKYRQYLGVEVPDDLSGCLQDVHWSHGSFGYFATYSIGSLYAAQLWATILKTNPETESSLQKGDSGPVLRWLRQHIHPFGRYYDSRSLCEKATGEKLNPDYFLQYAKRKFYDIYKK